MSTPTKLRCAVYTRKSTDEGLDQEFNSLDAQREACVAFIASQVGLGWKLVANHYDDGGISGGTMERPALQRLLQDIRDKRVDVVVVYKIDRLTRALMDFSKIVEIFDASSVSFVSVTQQFNTTTSMGRLTLNVLLSFAQFEREVTAERIRDKIAASKKKGMWMGGRVPLGYEVKDRKLLVNEVEAAAVRHLFDRYRELGSVLALAEEINRHNACERSRPSDAATARHHQPFTRGKLYYLLSNQIYVGRLKQHDRHFDGEHPSIIDPKVFAEVQTMLAGHARRTKGSESSPDTHLLTGIIFDETGDRLSPSYATNNGRRYRYYVSKRLKVSRMTGDGAWRVPAQELHAIVEHQLLNILADPKRLAEWVQEFASTEHIEPAIATAGSLGRIWKDPMAADQKRNILQTIFRRITLHADKVSFIVDPRATISVLLGIQDSGSTEQIDPSMGTESCTVIDLPFSIKRRGVEARMILAGSGSQSRKPDKALVDLLAKANLYLAKLTDGTDRNVAEVAKLCGAHRADVSRILPLAFLAPTIVDAIKNGEQSADLSARKLARSDLPFAWHDQAKVFGL